MKYKIKSVEKSGYSAELIRKKLIDMIERGDGDQIIKAYGMMQRIFRKK